MDLSDVATLLVTVIGAFAAVASAVAAFLAWRAADSSARAAQQMTQIEAERRHVERTPKLACLLKYPQGRISTADEDVELEIHLMGPEELERVDELTVRIRPVHDPVEGMPENTVWGPYRFAGDGDPAERTCPTPLFRHQPVALRLSPGFIPDDYARAHPGLLGEWAGAPLLLAVTCTYNHGGGSDTWTVHLRVPNEVVDCNVLPPV
ncbi:hypothetical protein HUT17_04800 (plasmid) [Nocardiopsis flavescens]|nr:hypothetical protein HUT17_04800 [Nocardiopsis flavescens]